jgi:hypothetical protein
MRYNGRLITKTTFRGARFSCKDCGYQGCYPGLTIKSIKGEPCQKCGSKNIQWGKAKIAA